MYDAQLTFLRRLERSVHNIERVRDTAIRRYKDFKIPWEWMLDTGMIAQVRRLLLNLYRRSVCEKRSGILHIHTCGHLIAFLFPKNSNFDMHHAKF